MATLACCSHRHTFVPGKRANMSRKHFIALANELRLMRPAPDTLQAEQWMRDVRAIARACEKNSTTFKRARFIEACEE